MRKTLTLMLSLIVILTLVLAACGPDNPFPPGPTPVPAPQKPVLVGLADFHTHMFGYLGFAGQLSSHTVDPTTPCLPILQYNNPSLPELQLRLVDLVRRGFVGEAVEQAKKGQCYPTVTNLVSQRMDTRNLKRAWEYGLRLMVVFAVNSEFLCEVARLSPPGSCPSDREAIDVQIQAAKDLEAQIDAASGGPGKGWYRIVYTPEQARQVIGQGKLAVVLGVEASNAFGGCRFVPSGTVPGVCAGVGGCPGETGWKLVCGAYNDWPGLESLQTQEALALFEHYWQLGVRQFFPIHNMDGTAGGTALSIPLMHADNNPSQRAPGSLLNKVPEINNLLRAVRPLVQSWNCSSKFQFDGGRCNTLGLTATGRYLIQMMASYGAMIDIDHMSWKAKRELLADDGLFSGVYPFVSSHSGIQEINHGDKNNEGQLAVEDFAAMVRAGGAFAPILPPATYTSEEKTYPADAPPPSQHNCGGTSETWVQAYRYVVDKLRGKLPNGEYVCPKLINGKCAFVGVGFGTDFNAPVPVAASPRFDDSTAPIRGFFDTEGLVIGGSLSGRGGLCYLVSPESIPNNLPHVTYPFKSSSPLSRDKPFDRSTTPWAGTSKQYDISFDGVVNYGMIPDFVEELYALGLTQDDLQPLWHGAEAYIRAWETSMAWQGNFTAEDDKGIRKECSTLRAEMLKSDISVYGEPHWLLDYASNGFGNWNVTYSESEWPKHPDGFYTSDPAPADYDGDGKADLSVKGPYDGRWLIDYASNGFGKWDVSYSGRGGADAHPVPADYDGDHKADLSVKTDDGRWMIDHASNGFGVWEIGYSGYGGADAHPVPADYDGDGKADLSVKTDDGRWLIDYASNGFGKWDVSYSGYGDTRAHPVPADYDGDGKADLSVKTDDGRWLIDYASNGFGRWDVTYSGYGDAKAHPVPADYDGDRKADLSVVTDVLLNVKSGQWLIDYASNGFGSWDDAYPPDGWPEYSFPDVSHVPADYDGDGKADLSVVTDDDFGWAKVVATRAMLDLLKQKGCDGFPQIYVPNIVGMTMSQGEAALGTAGLRVGGITDSSGKTVYKSQADKILSTSPQSGATVNKDSAVALVVSILPPIVTVPNIVGMTVSDGEAALGTVGLRVGRITDQIGRTSTDRYVHILSTSPQAGATVNRDSAVDLVVSGRAIATPTPLPPCPRKCPRDPDTKECECPNFDE